MPGSFYRILPFSWPHVSWLTLLLPNICTIILLNGTSLISHGGVELQTKDAICHEKHLAEQREHVTLVPGTEEVSLKVGGFDTAAA